MTIEQAERQRIIDSVEQNWTELIQTLETFDEAALLEPDVIGIWSIADLLNHIETWDGNAIRILEHAEKGDDRPWWIAAGLNYDSVDEFNEADVEKKRNRSIDMRWSLLHKTHAELITTLERSPALTDVKIEGDTSGHYAEHLQDIRRWQEQRTRIDN
ncbi:MAG: ClbS/DfsB family four-helix bundle protein [Sphaerobacteraceae bacterium]|nr:MAG: ClbS/DfsB family four-helix bundle protein [Sphaerobacteraceae bacterium]